MDNDDAAKEAAAKKAAAKAKAEKEFKRKFNKFDGLLHEDDGSRTDPNDGKKVSCCLCG